MEKLTPTQMVEAMAQVPLFAALNAGDRARWLDRCHARHLPAGTNVLSPREEADRFFAILAGRVKVFKLSAAGDEQTLHLYGPGKTFAEAAMFAGTQFPAYAETVDPSCLLIITREALRSAIAEDAEMAMQLLAGMAAKLREFNRLIEDLSLKEVPARLAGVLSRLAAGAGAAEFKLPMSKRQLAAQIGTTPESLSRALKKLADEGLIAVQGRSIVVSNAAALAARAEGDG